MRMEANPSVVVVSIVYQMLPIIFSFQTYSSYSRKLFLCKNKTNKQKHSQSSGIKFLFYYVSGFCRSRIRQDTAGMAMSLHYKCQDPHLGIHE